MLGENPIYEKSHGDRRVGSSIFTVRGGHPLRPALSRTPRSICGMGSYPHYPRQCRTFVQTRVWSSPVAAQGAHGCDWCAEYSGTPNAVATDRHLPWVGL